MTTFVVSMQRQVLPPERDAEAPTSSWLQFQVVATLEESTKHCHEHGVDE